MAVDSEAVRGAASLRRRNSQLSRVAANDAKTRYRQVSTAVGPWSGVSAGQRFRCSADSLLANGHRLCRCSACTVVCVGFCCRAARKSSSASAQGCTTAGVHITCAERHHST